MKYRRASDGRVIDVRSPIKAPGWEPVGEAARQPVDEKPRPAKKPTKKKN